MLDIGLQPPRMHFLSFTVAYVLFVLAGICTSLKIRARNFTSVDGTRIYAEAVGSVANQPLLWLHGDSFSGLAFDKQFDDRRLSESFFMVRMDLRGMGRSAKPTDPSNINSWTPDKQAGDVQAVIQGFGLRKPVLLGWSYGATIIADYISQHGVDDLSGIVVFGSTIGPSSNIGQFFTIPVQILNDLGDVNALSDKLDHVISQFVWRLSFTPFSQRDFVTMKGIAFGTDSETRNMVSLRPVDWTPMTNANKTLPLLLIAGEHDSISSPGFVDAFIQSGNWSSELLTTKIIRNAGHVSFWEMPREFSMIVEDWVKGLKRK
ncbi:hypothetical protein QCA50_015562 [Cerrena zonata]|uniref:AB hydrolase-1 domain-containing protein n=1 Tax=Cerrena zonata TaxID=2478898 RepID=A0AAW0FRB4_9APHY